MTRIPLLICLFLISGCISQKPDKSLKEKTEKKLHIKKNMNVRVVHVFVSLCDNLYQGIAKVPVSLGNGQEASQNLYWGAKYGLKTFFQAETEWELMQTEVNPNSVILERCVFKHPTQNAWLVADAYNGAKIQKCTYDFLKSCAGDFNNYFIHEKDTLACGGNADLITYIGHDGLMEFELEGNFLPRNTQKREAVILACSSHHYFYPYITQSQAYPLIWTNGNMAPESYTLAAILEEWLNHKDPQHIHKAAAKAYSSYQKCDYAAAANLFDTGK